ncbi:MAG: CopG family transcriptional regulator [Deltaproteobacteria bacterium]|nr:CopG family transcriptional regulator [Deltaproteobacteria bacterium]
MLGVRLSEELENKIAEHIKKTNITKSQFVKQAISFFLRQQELKNLHDERTAQGLREIKQGYGIPGTVIFEMLNKWNRDE